MFLKHTNKLSLTITNLHDLEVTIKYMKKYEEVLHKEVMKASTTFLEINLVMEAHYDKEKRKNFIIDMFMIFMHSLQ